MKKIPFAGVALIALLQCQPQQRFNTLPRANLVDAIGIEVSDTTREFAYTNKEAGFYYGETNSENKNGWQGWNIMTHEMLDDYRILIDGKALSKRQVDVARVYPYQLVRRYKNNVKETVTLLDSVNALVVELDGRTSLVVGQQSEIEIQPLFTDSNKRDSYEVKFLDGVLLIAERSHLRNELHRTVQRTSKEDYSIWVGIYAGEGAACSESQDGSGLQYCPASIKCKMRKAGCRIVFAVEETETKTVDLAHRVYQEADRRIQQRKDRMERPLQYSYVRTDDERFDRALMWAKISIDALIMNQPQAGKPVKGIFAGLPWFNNYWGRDTFISLPGAALVTGNFNDAKEILLSFSSFQEKDPKNTNYGRIPNQVTPTEVIYNTADGTPWFVRQAFEYIKYSRDTAFAKDIYAVVKRSIEGTLKYHMDRCYFLTHADAETWMDAVGPSGPWSPRGNRAVDIQALWYRQLRSGAELARMNGDQASAKAWNDIADKLKANFLSASDGFLDTTNVLLYDHLNINGTPDKQLRPNQLFALNEEGLIGSSAWRIRNLKSVIGKLAYPYGVATLSQEDENFHPFHHYEPYYVQDAAYHNGIVWTWLTGQVIEALCNFGQQELAYALTENMVRQILERGAVGTLSELLDAVPRSGEKEPGLSGTFSQAWSLAEFIRSFYQSYLGVNPNAMENSLYFLPTLPKQLGRVEFIVDFGGIPIKVHYDFAENRKTVTLASRFLSSSISIPLALFIEPNAMMLSKATLQPNTKLMIIFEKDKEEWTVTAYQNGAKTGVPFERFVTPPSERGLYTGFHFAVPKIREDLPALRGPEYPLLKLDQIKQVNANARVTCDVSDPEHDDRGDGNYVYPANSNFRDGILDITHFTVSSDERNVYFKMRYRNLANPGWHSEYGYQLTYTAIALHQRENEGSVDVGMNSKYILERKSAYQRIIFVGGGFRIQDTRGKILAAYLPVVEDVRNPLGDASTGTISFSVPLEYLGVPNGDWQFTVLVGAQDDHGGAGIGEFRNVEARGGEWIGGGKANPNQPNVYDVILPK